MKIKYFSLVTAMLLTTSMNAQTELDTIDVNDNGIQRDDLQLDSATNLYKVNESSKAGVEVYTSEDIKKSSAKDVFDLLNQATGIDLTYQGRRSPFGINIRGNGTVTYIVDGAILPPSVSRILYKLPMSAIDEIQIVRSATELSIAPSINVGASNSGSGVNIGYVIIRTKQPKKTEGLFTFFGEKAVSQPYANGQTLYGGTRFGDSSSWNGYIGAMVSRFDRRSKESWFDGSNSESGMVNGGIANGKFKLNFLLYKDSGLQEMQRGVKEDGTLDNAKWYYDPLKSTILSVDGSMVWNEDQVTLFSAAQTKYEQNEHNENFATPAVSTRSYEEKANTYSLRHNATFGDTKLQFGTQYVETSGLGADLYNSFKEYDTSIMGASASVEQSLFNGDLVVDAGYRWDQKHIESSSAAKKNTPAAPDANTDVDLAPASIITLGTAYKLSDSQKLSARYFYGNQGIAGDFTIETEDGSKLDSEVQHRYELSLESNFDRTFNSQITYFDTNIQNEKRATSTTYIVDGEEYYYYEQLDQHTKGVELVVKGKFEKTTNYKLSWTHILSQEVDEADSSVDEVGLLIPQNTYSALLSHKYEDYRFNLSGKVVSPYTGSISPLGQLSASLGDYTRIDANVIKSFDYYGVPTTFKLYGRNLNNNHYATRYVTGYYYDRGRTVGLELTTTF